MNGSGYISKRCGPIEGDLQRKTVVNEDLTSGGSHRSTSGVVLQHTSTLGEKKLGPASLLQDCSECWKQGTGGISLPELTPDPNYNAAVGVLGVTQVPFMSLLFSRAVHRQ